MKVSILPRTALPVFLLLLLSGCLNQKKMNKWVTGHYGETAAVPVKKKNDFLAVKSSIPDAGTALSQGSKKTHSVLPLLFYWRFNYDNTCELNPQIPINNFINTASPYANKVLKKKLEGKHVELTIEKIPNRFVVADKAQVIWFIYGFAWDQISIKPLDDQMLVTYKILNAANAEEKTGSVSVINTDKGVAVGQFQSVRKRTDQYLGDYNLAITSMTRMVIDRIAAEL